MKYVGRCIRFPVFLKFYFAFSFSMFHANQVLKYNEILFSLDRNYWIEALCWAEVIWIDRKIFGLYEIYPKFITFALWFLVQSNWLAHHHFHNNCTISDGTTNSILDLKSTTFILNSEFLRIIGLLYSKFIYKRRFIGFCPMNLTKSSINCKQSLNKTKNRVP